MIHLSQGILRAYIDNELSVEARGRAAQHLETCPRCQADLESLAGRMARIERRLGLLSTLPDEARLQAGSARARLETRIAEKENTRMFQKNLSRIPRLAWAALGVVLILGVAMLFPGVRAVADSFLGLFRVEQFTIVQFDAQNLDELGSSSHLEYLLSEDVQAEYIGQKQPVEDEAQASSLAGIPVRLPQGMETTPAMYVDQGARITFKVDLPRVNALAQEVGLQDLNLPQELDGSTVSMEIPRAVVSQYGDCQDSPETGPIFQDCPRLIQVASPTVTAPEELDVAAIGEAFLKVLGMSPQEAASFSSNVDWTTTLILPLPRQGTSYQDVFVDGVRGNLIKYRGFQDGRRMDLKMVIWVKDGVVYALSGVKDSTEIVNMANSLP
jgi:hypothetical protein